MAGIGRTTVHSHRQAGTRDVAGLGQRLLGPTEERIEVGYDQTVIREQAANVRVRQTVGVSPLDVLGPKRESLVVPCNGSLDHFRNSTTEHRPRAEDEIPGAEHGDFSE